MWRKIEERLKSILTDDNQLPILLLGARQIGKTYTTKKVAKDLFEDKYIYINFLEKDELFKQLNGLTSPKQILDTIEYYFKIRIKDYKLIIFDEIQEIPSLKTSIKLFVENQINIKIICLGSYLANTLFNDNYSFPVGKVQMIDMFQMDFEEFLIASGYDEYVDLIKYHLKELIPLDKLKHSFLIDLVYDYMLIGGMPAAIDNYLKTKQIETTYEIKQNLHNQYRSDLTKYVYKNINKTKSLLIYDNIDLFLAKVNKKYKLSNVESSMKYLNSENAIKNLMITKIVYKINNLKSVSLPLSTKQKENEFKIYYNDCGFVSYIFRLNKTILTTKDEMYANQKGALAENYVFSQIAMKTDWFYYFSFRGNANCIDQNQERNKSNTEYEIDLCLEDNQINFVPVEIKFGNQFSKSSLNKVMNENKPKYGIVLSSKNLSYDEESRVLNLPLYIIAFLEFEMGRLVNLFGSNKESK